MSNEKNTASILIESYELHSPDTWANHDGLLIQFVPINKEEWLYQCMITPGQGDINLINRDDLIGQLEGAIEDLKRGVKHV